MRITAAAYCAAQLGPHCAQAMTRRRFAFWVGFGLFSLADKLRIEGLDTLAAATMEGAAPRPKKPALPEHWTTAGDETWSWFERENLIDGEWVLTGTTRPLNKKTGELKAASDAYLEDGLVPVGMRPDIKDRKEIAPEEAAVADEAAAATNEEDSPRRLPESTRRARHGRPPSKWLRSLDADELRIWLKTVEVPEAGVSGMTYWEHLTRDHSFDPAMIEGLVIAEQSKLHAAAHFGY